MTEPRTNERRLDALQAFKGIGPDAWMPACYTLPLSEDFPSDGDRLLEVVDLAWKSPEADEFNLDEWQRWLLRHILERYPDDHPKYPGQLRYRQVVISLGRQNGKSVLAAILGLYGLLLQTKGPEVISVAYSVEQARIVYDRVKHVVANNPALTRRFKPTGTRGIRSRIDAKPGSYVVKAGAEESLQGVPISLCLGDELHLWKETSWDAIVLGTSARNGLVIGITTAGDDKSELLKRLYAQGKAAVDGMDGADERMGFFLWEAPEDARVDDPEALIAANPAIACGRMDLEQELRVVRNMPEPQARRYRLNQFISHENSWLPMSMWHGAGKGQVPQDAKVVFTVARARNWNYATINASAKVDGVIYTEVVASLVNPSLESLEDLCVTLNRHYRPIQWLMESGDLKDLALRLRERGCKVEYLTLTQMMNVCATAYSLISQGKVVHADDPVVNRQMPKAVSKNYGDGWRISVRESDGDVDAVIATVIGIYGAENAKPNAPALYVA